MAYFTKSVNFPAENVPIVKQSNLSNCYVYDILPLIPRVLCGLLVVTSIEAERRMIVAFSFVCVIPTAFHEKKGKKPREMESKHRRSFHTET